MKRKDYTVETADLPLADLLTNEGQLEGVPANPRQITGPELDKLIASLRETPELLEGRGILCVPYGEQFVILGGNMRAEALRKMGETTAPCVIYHGLTAEKMREIVIKDNGSFGEWDFDALANAWDDLPLKDWGVEAPADWTKDGLSSKGREGDEDYQQFVDKFNEEQPLTTDDCYTPPVVYDLVRDFVAEHLAPLDGVKIVRPFYPGGDYEKLDQYPDGCIVIDNPPFSMYAKIVRFYMANGIRFFLFGPQLSLLVSDADCCFCPFNVVITYENGAKVNTGFVTNLRPGIRIWIDHQLRDAVAVAQKSEPTTPVYNYPPEVVSSATLGKIANGGDLEISAADCHYIHNLDGMKEIERGLFGGGFLLSRAAAEKARAAAEKARAVNISLSPREQAIVASLG